MDAQSCAGESTALLALATACVAQAALDYDAGRTARRRPDRLIEENFWRATRYGLDGKLIDLDAVAEIPAAAAVERLLEWTADARAELGARRAPRATSSRCSRTATAPSASGAGTRPASRCEDIYAATVAETRATYADGRRGAGGAVRRGDDDESRARTTTSTSTRHEHLSEEELRAQLEEELRRITVRDVLLQTIVSLVNLGGQRLGLAPGAEDMRDLDQARLAIEGVRALLPLLEEQDAEQVRPIRDALSQLQMAYAQLAGRRAARRSRARRRPQRPEQQAPRAERPDRPGRRRRPLGAAGQRRLIATAGARRQAAYRGRPIHCGALLAPGPLGRFAPAAAARANARTMTEGVAM